MARIVWQREGLSWDEVCRRASARRKWNECRQELARQRRDQILHLWLQTDVTWGWQSRVAVALGVHRSTVCRDLQRLLASWSSARPNILALGQFCTDGAFILEDLMAEWGRLELQAMGYVKHGGCAAGV